VYRRSGVRFDGDAWGDQPLRRVGLRLGVNKHRASCSLLEVGFVEALVVFSRNRTQRPPIELEQNAKPLAFARRQKIRVVAVNHDEKRWLCVPGTFIKKTRNLVDVAVERVC